MVEIFLLSGFIFYSHSIHNQYPERIEGSNVIYTVIIVKLKFDIKRNQFSAKEEERQTHELENKKRFTMLWLVQ